MMREVQPKSLRDAPSDAARPACNVLVSYDGGKTRVPESDITEMVDWFYVVAYEVQPTHYTLRTRTRVEVNTDPQRRCYNGCHFSSELIDTPWETLESHIPAAKAQAKMQFWRELNDYAVSQRGEGARKWFELVPEEPA